MFLSFKKDKKLIIKSFKIMFFVSFSQLIISLILFIDVFMISAYGEEHFSAIGIAAETWFIFQAPMIGFSTLFGILYAQYKNNKKNFTELAKINMWFVLFLIILISLVVFFLGRNIIEIFFIKDNYIDDKNINSNEVKNLIVKYLKIISLGNIFTTIAINLINPIVMIGKTIYMFYMSVIALTINIIFNYLLIYVANLGVVGAGWSTTISYFFELIFAGFIVYKNKLIFGKFNNIFKLNKKIIVSILKKIALPLSSILMFWTFALSTVLITIQYGVKMMQSLSIFYSIAGMMISILPAIRKTVSILIGQQLGENNYNVAIMRSKKLVKIVLLITILFVFISIILAFIIPDLTINDKKASNQAKYMIIIFGGTLFAYSLQTYYSSILESAGMQLLPSIFNYWTSLWIQIPLIIILGPWVFNLSFINMYLIQSLVIYVTIIPLYIAKQKNKWLINLNKEIS